MELDSRELYIYTSRHQVFIFTGKNIIQGSIHPEQGEQGPGGLPRLHDPRRYQGNCRQHQVIIYIYRVDHKEWRVEYLPLCWEEFIKFKNFWSMNFVYI